METFPISIYPDLGELGSTRVLRGVLEQASYRMGEQVLETPEGVFYDLTLSNTGEGILLAGTATTEVVTPCARCLKPARATVAGEVEGYYVVDGTVDPQDYEADEYDQVGDDGVIDLSGPIEAAISYGTPFVIMCADDCAGLCPTCGADLNEGPCGCESEDDIDPDNPFAALRNFKFE